MLLTIGLIYLATGVIVVVIAKRSQKSGRIEGEDGFDLRRRRNPLLFRLSITADYFFGLLMIALSIMLMAGYFIAH